MQYFDEDKVRQLLPVEELIPAMRQALAEFSAGKWQHPVRGVLGQHGGFFGVMPASGEAMGIKMVSFYSRNAGTNFLSHLAVIALFDALNCEPVPLMDLRYI